MSRAAKQASMFRRQTHISEWPLILVAACLSSVATARAGDTFKTPIKLSGAIGGIVTNNSGAPQMGASVILLNRQERVCDRMLTDEKGEFRFPGLFPDLYTIRVTLATFVPALKRDILVQSGANALLTVNLNSLFSSIQVAYPPAGSGAFMTDDWKWVLRSASATRPVLRFAEETDSRSSSQKSHGTVFSDTRGLLQLSAGDGPLVTGTGDQADLGTAFALATSVFGNNHLELSGNFGYGAQTGVPVSAFRTSYAGSSGPEISVTMRQLYLPGRLGAGAPDVGPPALRSVSASLDEHIDLTDEATLQYGFTLDSVSLGGDRLNYASPYARLVYSLGDNGSVAVAYSSGNARPDLAAQAGESSAPDLDLQRDLDSIGLFPRISVLNDNPRIQRGSETELSYSRKWGSRRVDVSAYREVVTNAALSLAGPVNMGLYSTGDLLPDLLTGNAIMNVGSYSASGYTAAFTQELGPNVSATIMYGTTPGLSVTGQEIESGSPDELRSMIRESRRQSFTARIAATAPWIGTHVVGSYQWAGDSDWMALGNLYSMQSVRPIPGLNLYIRQPVPRIAILPWRIEVTADLRNLLAEGYLPLETNGQQLVLVQTPRSFRGGLSFIF
jgi:hypothetical protein